MKYKKEIVVTSLLIGSLLVVTGISILSKPDPGKNSTIQLSATDKLIRTAKNKLAAKPNDVNVYVSLCQNYLQKVRENADTTYYSKCDELMTKASKLDSNNAEIIATKAAVAYGRHSFKTGLELSIKAQELNPNKVSYYGLVGDGQIELGQYEGAVQSFQTMINKRPELSSYNRVAYIRELYGDIEGAKAALQSAIQSGSSFQENVAYSQVELGKLYMRDNLEKAQRSYEQALNTSPEYPPALEGLGKVAFAKKNYKQAIVHFQKAFDDLPLAQYAVALGDTYKTIGNNPKAEQQYYLAQLAFDKSNSGGVNNDYEISTFLSNHDKNNKQALELAKASTNQRPNIFSSDSLAWALYKSGDYIQADAQSKEALRLGENEPILLYHRGLIVNKLGQREQAKQYLKKAFTLDRYFSGSHFSLLDMAEGEKTLQRLN